MRFATEFSADAERDFDLIFDRLFESYVVVDEGTREALGHGGDWSQLKSTVDNARSSVSTIRSHSARVITSGGDMVIVLP